MSLAELETEIRRLSELLDRGIEAARANSEVYADAENSYRHAKARAWVEAPREGPDGRNLIAPEREAMVNAACAEQRRERDLADDQRRTVREALRARQGQLSAMQSLLSAHRSEADFARTGPR